MFIFIINLSRLGCQKGTSRQRDKYTDSNIGHQEIVRDIIWLNIIVIIAEPFMMERAFVRYVERWSVKRFL